MTISWLKEKIIKTTLANNDAMNKGNLFAEIATSLLVFLSVFLFWKNNFLLTLIFIAAILVLLVPSRNVREAYLVAIGLTLGILIEAGAQLIGFESYSNPTFFGIPLWMPFMWSYAFIAIYRVGRALCKE